MRKVALAAGGVSIALALGLGIPALVEHARERAAWSTEREKQGTAAYDPAASDAHYRASRDAWQASALPGHLLGAGLLLFTLGAVRRDARRAPTGFRRRAALVVDLALAAALLSLLWLDAGESAAVRSLTHAAPWLCALPLAPRLVGGATPGTRLLGLRPPSPGAER